MSKLEEFKSAIKASIVFDARTDCHTCPIGKLCDSAIADALIMKAYFGGCQSAFLSAVIAGIIDLDGTPIKEFE